jgi:hypothetical protein
MRPTFLGIGAQRAGTTRLHQLLSGHPQIRMPTTGTDSFGKELHFFNRRVTSHDLGWYEKQFAPAAGRPPQPVRGEITPAYSTLAPAVVAGIREYAPDLKLVLIIRHPVDRIWSQLRLRASPRTTRAGRGTSSVRRLIAEAETSETVLRTDYGRTIDVWTSAFGPEALLVVLFEEQFTDPDATLRRILGHIGADPSWSPGEARLREKVWAAPALEIPELLAVHLARRWLGPTEALDRRLGGRVAHWVADLRDRCGRASPGAGALSATYRVMATPRTALSLGRHAVRSRRLARRMRRLLRARAATAVTSPR